MPGELLMSRAESVLQFRERLEVLELWAMAAARAGQLRIAQQRLAEAVRMGRRNPAVASERHRRTDLVHIRIVALTLPWSGVSSRGPNAAAQMPQ